MLLIVTGPRGYGGIVAGALRNPTHDELDLRRRKRWLVLRHFGLAILGRDQADQMALGGLARYDRGFTALAPLEHALKASHHIVAPCLGRLVATLTARLKNGTDLLVVADLA